jgi:hypothetical protein
VSSATCPAARVVEASRVAQRARHRLRCGNEEMGPAVSSASSRSQRASRNRSTAALVAARNAHGEEQAGVLLPCTMPPISVHLPRG